MERVNEGALGQMAAEPYHRDYDTSSHRGKLAQTLYFWIFFTCCVFRKTLIILKTRDNLNTLGIKLESH